MVAATLECIARDDEIGHLLVKLIAPTFVLRSHAIPVKIDEGDVLHMLLPTPLATTLSGHVATAPAATRNLRLTALTTTRTQIRLFSAHLRCVNIINPHTPSVFAIKKY